ncbi:hypothetical protein [Streptomyces sp. Ncost-T10-10d]|uniref:hypothetical protein n=1 Tax=Streptomyces sp. Ncost-T10-10d TaxID=1839774 RepID=UPI00081F51D3|nr:hypothetical protein [Streptomyces sp. Ncost-T10-10d]SCF62006.1 hypothetical protein GA0115254_108118 [Streptomyces sp. Ncost-T10-10d]
METGERLRRTRSYYWGCIYASDEEEGDFGDLDGPGPIWTSHCWVTIQVRHARLVAKEEADVALTIEVRQTAAADFAYQATIDLPSGVLSVGDADSDEALRLAPGTWLMQVDLDSPDDATNVRIVLSPARPSN